jgi:CRISPR-associated endonuclease Csn1
MNWRLGLDIGTNSIGWSAVELGSDGSHRYPIGITSSGVRIFSDSRNPKSKQSLAAARRLPRQQRRMRDRYLRRRSRFMHALEKHGLMPGKSVMVKHPVKPGEIQLRKLVEEEDPWVLRYKGLDEALTLHQLGRALFHLQQRRGFKSNRKTDAGANEESGKIKSAASAVVKAMEKDGIRTYGELLAGPRVKDPKSAHTHPVRSRLKGAGAKAQYDFYPTRDLIASEFDCLWESQLRFHESELTEDARSELRDILLFQRNLKPQPVGKCSLDPSEERAPKALPSVQRLRIFQEINHLSVLSPGEPARPLTIEERDILIVKALGTSQLKFDAARKALKLSSDIRFNLESDKRKHLDGDKTAAVLASTSRWGKSWRDLAPEDQETIIEKLLDEEVESTLVEWLHANWGLAEEIAILVANSALPAGHGQLGKTASGVVLSELEKGVVPFNEAVVSAGYPSHSQLDFDGDGEVFDLLPYYGEVIERHVAFGSGNPDDRPEVRFGKIANPTVHVALNQVRQVVNDLTRRFGLPAEIVVELARDLPLSAQGKSDLDRTQRDNQKANDVRRETLKELGQADTYANRMRLRLWEELNPKDVLNRRCPYSGEQISQTRLFSAEVEIEHILPFSSTLDDGIGNKTLSLRSANRFKGQKSPYEAFSSSPEAYDWDDILARSASMPNNKSWRFGPDAMDRYKDSERDFLARQLVDTQYMSRLATLYLKRTGASVWVTPGRFTSNLRWAWGLDSVLAGHNEEEAGDPVKNRNDHRHHAVDAIVIALTDRALLNHVASVAAKAEVKFDKRYLANIDTPWDNFREDVIETVGKIIVSHKSDHGVQGALHNDTAYGVVEPPDSSGRSKVVHRVPLGTLNAKQLDGIRDPLIRDHLKNATVGLEGKTFIDSLVAAGEAMSPPVRKVRVLETMTVIPTVMNAEGKALKAYKGDANYCYDIYSDDKSNWTGRVVSRFEANQRGFKLHSKFQSDGTALVMRIRGNDLLGVQAEDGIRILRVVKFTTGVITLAEHNEAGPLKARDADKQDIFKYLYVSPSKLQKLKARQVKVTPSGRLFDPGFP